MKIYTLEDLLWQQEGNELLHEMNRQIFYERLNDQIPKENVKDLDDIPQEVKDAVTFIPCSNVSQVLHNALVK